MFKSKSFDLVNEERTKKPERLYQPRRMRWLKYIILPAVFSFALLLILVNVDFSDNDDKITSAVTNEESELQSLDINAISQEICDTSLLISNTEFKNNTLERSVFFESCELQSLTIEKCSIAYIADGTFDQNSTHNLLSLQLINVELENLTEAALQGLQTLQNFTLVNDNNSFRPFGFLSSVAYTLINARIHQRNSSETYAISDFLGSGNFTQLIYLDLSETNLGGTLSDTNFENLPALEKLVLEGCGLIEIKWDFLPIRLQMSRQSDLRETEASTVQIAKHLDPELQGSSATTSTTEFMQPSTEETTIGPTSPPPPTCDRESCEELVCNRFSSNLTNGTVNQEECNDNILVEICESECITPTYFCVVLGENFTSSFNCCSHKTMRCVVSAKATWFEDHSGLVIGLGVGLLLVGSLLGMIIVYGTLRLKPSLIKGAKRRESNAAVLIPRKFEKDVYENVGGPISTLDNNEYVTAYHRYLEQANHRFTESIKYIYPPRDRAPSVPPSSDYPLPLPARNNYIYESCELYEELP
ncbi:uncharacterized protein LOC108090095 [Drosophila ficusphila]|uniref:uncharacterized protein LOC108090095 n=1 Tax=Drosophila ficusphila TaxID=30025 RepID=UPI0007E7E4A2|nr:uncharacterized protein LOC108090095 [Drosophila ficusphila]